MHGSHQLIEAFEGHVIQDRDLVIVSGLDRPEELGRLRRVWPYHNFHFPLSSPDLLPKDLKEQFRILFLIEFHQRSFHGVGALSQQVLNHWVLEHWRLSRSRLPGELR